MSGTPELSVIVPAHDAEALLPESLGALVASTLPRSRWELLVVDDASRDATAAVAERQADRVLALHGDPVGPGGARNVAAGVARGAWLVFVDADVRLHPDALQRFADTIDGADDRLVALFGSYDAHPAAPGVVSQYRNLLHRYTHLQGAGESETFWAGCGAVRRSAFEAVGGFDTARFPRPQIEDIDLGYRLRDQGGRIVLDPSIQGTHLKRWRLGAMLRTDVVDRGIPWMRLLLERRGRTTPTLNTGGLEPLRVALAGVGTTTLVAAVVLAQPAIAAAGVVSFGLLTVMNLPAARWFARERGVGFALQVVPLQLVHYIGNAAAAAIGIVQHLTRASGGNR